MFGIENVFTFVLIFFFVFGLEMKVRTAFPQIWFGSANRVGSGTGRRLGSYTLSLSFFPFSPFSFSFSFPSCSSLPLQTGLLPFYRHFHLHACSMCSTCRHFDTWLAMCPTCRHLDTWLVMCHPTLTTSKNVKF